MVKETDINYRFLLTKYMAYLYDDIGMIPVPDGKLYADNEWLQQELNDLKRRSEMVIRAKS